MASDVQRYTWLRLGMAESYEGAWMRHDAHEAAIARQTAEIEALKALVRRFQTAASQAKAALDDALEGGDKPRSHLF